MNKIILLTCLVLLINLGNCIAQNGRPAAINNSPKIGARNINNEPTVNERLAALETKLAAVTDENKTLKEQIASLNASILGLSSNLVQLNNKFTNQVGTFRIKGYIKASNFMFNVQTAGAPANVLTGSQE
jgi:peptidoglycan hydrolase CwlO-like protein